MINRWLQPRLDRWLQRRLPPSNEILLTNKRLFIFPTRAGFAWLVLLILCWLAATNYENNVVFAFACLLASLFVVSILATFGNLSGVRVRYLKSSPVFAGENVLLELLLTQPGKRYRESIRLSFEYAEPVTVILNGLETVQVKIPVPTSNRGWFNPGRLRVESVYPLGLLRAWSRLDLNIRCLVYPQPIADTPLATTVAGKGDGPVTVGEGSEEFVGLNTYRPGDSLKRVAWKQFARGQGMHVKHYADAQSDELWLDWEAFPGHSRESRLSRLCGWLLQISSSPEVEDYGLRLPGVEIAPAQGEVHRQRILRHLATFELDGKGA